MLDPNRDNNSNNLTLDQQELENLTLSLAKATTKPASLRDDYTFSWCKSLRIVKPGDKDALKANFPTKGNEFMPISGGVFDVKEYLEKGYALSGFHFKNNHRKKDNCIKAGVLFGDIDNTGIDSEGNKIYVEQSTLEQALKNPFKRKYAAFQTSPSHTGEWHKFREIYFLPCDVDGLVYEQILKIINAIGNNAFDSNALEAGRLFYGCTYGEFYNWDNVQMLPYELVTYAQKLADRRKNEVEEKKAKRTAKLSDRKQNLSDTDINEVLTALDWISSEDYYDWIRVGMALKSHSESNFEIWDRWSSQSHKYNPSEIERKWNSFKKDGIGIGTIFWLASQNGYVFENVAINQYLEDESQILEQNYKHLGREISKEEWEDTNNHIINSWNRTDVSELILRLFGKHKVKPQSDKTVQRDSENKWVAEYETEQEKMELINSFDTVVDISDTGTGKSTFIGQYGRNILWDNELDKLFLIDKNHNNPSTPYVTDNYSNLFPRHKGLVQMDDGSWVKGEYVEGQPYIYPNCIHTDKFPEFVNKGYNINQETKDSEGNYYPNPICANCSERKSCRFGSLDSSKPNFLKRRKDTLARELIRCDSSQVTSDISDNYGAIYEEFDVELQGMVKDYEMSIYELNNLTGSISKYFDDSEKDLLTFARDLVDRIKTLFDKLKNEKYGVDYSTIREDLEQWLDENKRELLNRLAEKDFLKKIIEENKPSDSGEQWENLKNIPSNFLAHFVNVYLNKTNGYIRLTKFYKDTDGTIIPSKIVVTTRDDNKINFLRKAKKVFLMSATPLDYQSIADLRGCGYDDILVIKKKSRKPTNHTVTVLFNNKGIKSNCWSDKARERVSAILREDLKGIRPEDVMVMGKKSLLVEMGIDEKFTRHTHFGGGGGRGSNDYQDLNRQIILGLPNMNIGGKRAIYETLFKDSTDFDSYYHRCQKNELVQNLGRLRAVLKTEKCHTTIICKELDCEFLRDRGFNVIEKDILTTDYVDGMDAKQKRIKLIKFDLIRVLLSMDKAPTLADLCLKLFKENTANLRKELSRTLKELNTGMGTIKAIWDALHTKSNQKSQNPIRDFIEKCDFIPEWVKSNIDNYLGWLESKRIAPIWELDYRYFPEYEKLDMFEDELWLSGWILAIDPNQILIT